MLSVISRQHYVRAKLSFMWNKTQTQIEKEKKKELGNSGDCPSEKYVVK